MEPGLPNTVVNPSARSRSYVTWWMVFFSDMTTPFTVSRTCVSAVAHPLSRNLVHRRSRQALMIEVATTRRADIKHGFRRSEGVSSCGPDHHVANRIGRERQYRFTGVVGLSDLLSEGDGGAGDRSGVGMTFVGRGVADGGSHGDNCLAMTSGAGYSSSDRGLWWLGEFSGAGLRRDGNAGARGAVIAAAARGAGHGHRGSALEATEGGVDVGGAGVDSGHRRVGIHGDRPGPQVLIDDAERAVNEVAAIVGVAGVGHRVGTGEQAGGGCCNRWLQFLN